MRMPVLRSPIVLASVVLGGGLLVRWLVNPEFSVGCAMAFFLWILPMLGFAITYDDWGADASSPSFFSSPENRWEMLALLALPGLGFAIDEHGWTARTAIFSAFGLVGIVACVQLVRLELDRRAAGDDGGRGAAGTE